MNETNLCEITSIRAARLLWNNKDRLNKTLVCVCHELYINNLKIEKCTQIVYNIIQLHLLLPTLLGHTCTKIQIEIHSW